MIFDFKLDLKLAKDLILNGKIVILPTDTLFGFSCDAFNTQAITKLNQLKGRHTPLSIIVSNFEMANQFAFINNKQKMIIDKLLPGPFTFLFKKKQSKLAYEITNESPKVGIRIPDHFNLHKLLKKLNRPIVTTSVNRNGEPALSNPKKMDEEFNDIPIFIDKIKKKSNGSTIIDLTISPYLIIRKGDGEWIKV